MKFFKIASPKLAAYSILFPLFYILPFIITCIIGLGTHSSNWGFLIAGIVGSSLLIIGFIYYFRIAFCPYRMTPQGISNRHVTIDWENITTYEIYSVEVTPFFTPPFRKEITRVCAIPSTKAGSYRELNPRECVFFQVTKENLLLIDQYCSHKSEEIQDLLLRYSDLLGRPMD